MSLVFHAKPYLLFGGQTAQFTHVQRGLGYKLLTTPVAIRVVKGAIALALFTFI